MDVETLQLKLVYSAVYFSLGILAKDLIPRVTELLEKDRKDAFSEKTTQRRDSYDSDDGVLSTKLSRRFPSLEKAKTAFEKELGDDISRETAIAKWNELTRESPDKWMLRYIRQMGDTCKVLCSIAMTIHWRVTYRPDREIKRGEWFYIYSDPQPEYIAQLSSGKCSLVGRDRFGRPVICVRAALHFPADQCESVMKRLAVLALETALYHENDDCGGVVAIFDLTGYTHTNLDYSIISFMVHMANRVYPGLAAAVLIHNAPKIFLAIWRVIKLWIDPALANRFHFTSTKSELYEFVPVDQLPDYLGGFSYRTQWVQPELPNKTRLWDFKQRHILLNKHTSTQKEIEEVTCRWICGERLTSVRRDLMEAGEHNFWLLAPFVRSETSWDRQAPIEAQRRSSTDSLKKPLPFLAISPSSPSSGKWDQ